MRPVLLATATLAATFSAAAAAQANPNQLTSNAAASVFGGCNCGGVRQDQTTTTMPTLTSFATSTDGFGSFAHASVTTTYGTQRVYADAFQAPGDPGPDVQTQAYSEYDDHFGPNLITNYTLSFNVTGSMSVEPPFGPGADAYLLWEVIDTNVGGAITFGTWVVESGLPAPVVSYTVPLGDSTELDVRFVASAFSENTLSNYTIFADYSHTVHTYIDPVGGGPDVIGESGHDYATPTVAGGVPEPSTWALMLAGFAGLGAALRRHRPSPARA